MLPISASVQLRNAGSPQKTPSGVQQPRANEAIEPATPSSRLVSSPSTPSSAAALAFQENPIYDELPDDACSQPAVSTGSGSRGEQNSTAEVPAMNGTDLYGDHSLQHSAIGSAERQGTGSGSDAAGAAQDDATAGNPHQQGRLPHSTETTPGVAEESEGSHEEGVHPVQAAMDAIRKRADLMGVLLEDCNRMTEPDALVRIFLP
jgi:hypothetical protein